MSRRMRGNKFTGNPQSSDLIWPAEEAPRHVTKHRSIIKKGLKGPNIIIKSYCVKGGFGYLGELVISKDAGIVVNLRILLGSNYR